MGRMPAGGFAASAAAAWVWASVGLFCALVVNAIAHRAATQAVARWEAGDLVFCVCIGFKNSFGHAFQRNVSGEDEGFTRNNVCADGKTFYELLIARMGERQRHGADTDSTEERERADAL